MMLLERCPRCGGPRFAGRDGYGRYDACLFCGRYQEEVPIVPIDVKSLENEGVPRFERRRVRGPSKKGVRL